MQVCSIDPIGGLAKGNIPNMYVRTTMSLIVGKLMVKWGLHVHTRIHDIMYINGRL